MTTYNDDISQYITSLFAEEDEQLERTRVQTVERGLPEIHVTPEEGRFIQLLVRASGALKALEIGTLGGYSGTWIARGLAPGGRLITVELEEAHAAVARDHFQAAGVADRVEIITGDAHELMPQLRAEGPFDFVFIDAEKSGYPDYFDWALENVRSGGVIAAHNALARGHVALPEGDEDRAALMDAFNRRVAADPRVISTIFPAGDGTLIAVRND
jgi:predicted O-methyltransferase YrrM